MQTTLRGVPHARSRSFTIKEPAVQSGWTHSLAAVRTLVRRTGPYLAIELVLPGGTLIALLLFLYQRRQAGAKGRSPLRARLLPAWRRLQARGRRVLGSGRPAGAVQ
jgi:hypothetical protein